MQKLEDSPFQSPSNLSDKMKLLQKHQAFETEILAHKDLIATVNMVNMSIYNCNFPKGAFAGIQSKDSFHFNPLLPFRHRIDYASVSAN